MPPSWHLRAQFRGHVAAFSRTCVCRWARPTVAQTRRLGALARCPLSCCTCVAPGRCRVQVASRFPALTQGGCV